MIVSLTWLFINPFDVLYVVQLEPLNRAAPKSVPIQTHEESLVIYISFILSDGIPWELEVLYVWTVQDVIEAGKGRVISTTGSKLWTPREVPTHILLLTSIHST